MKTSSLAFASRFARSIKQKSSEQASKRRADLEGEDAVVKEDAFDRALGAEADVESSGRHARDHVAVRHAQLHHRLRPRQRLRIENGKLG